jgi:hypothetical protein
MGAAASGAPGTRRAQGCLRARWSAGLRLLEVVGILPGVIVHSGCSVAQSRGSREFWPRSVRSRRFADQIGVAGECEYGEGPDNGLDDPDEGGKPLAHCAGRVHLASASETAGA